MDRQMVRREDERDDTKILKEDQDMINKFARLTARTSELQDRKKEIDTDLQLLDDASNELILIDETDGVKVKMGDGFMRILQPEVESYVETLTDSSNEELAAITAEMGTIQGTLDDLKVKLYAKFGKSINLESPPDD